MKPSSLVRLGAVADFHNGVAFKQSDWVESGSHRIIRIQNLTDPGKPYNRTDRDVPEKNIAAPGDILVSWSGTLGVFEWHGSDRAYVNQHIFKVSPDTRVVDSRYLKAILEKALLDMGRHAHGAVMKHVNRKEFEGTLIPLPPLEEQKRIAAILDKADELRTKRKEAIAELNKLQQSVFLDMFGDPVTNPKGWSIQALTDVCSKITDGTHKTPQYTSDGVEFLSAKDLKDGCIKWGSKKYISEEEHQQLIKRCNPELGDILMAKSGSLGSVATVDREQEFSLFESLCLLKLDRNTANSSYIEAMLATDAMQRKLLSKNKGVAIKHLHLIDIRSLRVPIPPLAMQSAFDLKATAMKSFSQAYIGHVECLDQLFNALQSKAFKGEL